jgi:hypothetical protein
LITFKNLLIPFPALGYYQLVVIVNGQETMPSNRINVVQIERDADYAKRIICEITTLLFALIAFIYINVPGFALNMETSMSKLRQIGESIFLK